MPDVTLNGVTFPLKPEPPKQGRIMLLARAEKRGETAQMAAYLDLLESLLAEDHDPDEFEACIAEMDLSEIGDALKAATATYKVDPTSAGPKSSPRSADGPETGVRTSRVVSLSKGTVEHRETPASSTA